MEKINITIPDNLTTQEELLLIAKHLGKKLLPAGKTLIGTGYELKQLQTQINIVRESVEKPIVTHECPVCKTITERSICKTLWTNYGGVIRQHYYCSIVCRDEMLNIVGEGRASIKKNKVSRLWLSR